MSDRKYTDGQACPWAGCEGKLESIEEQAEDCSCHISPPCSACVEWQSQLRCSECGWQTADDPPEGEDARKEA